MCGGHVPRGRYDLYLNGRNFLNEISKTVGKAFEAKLDGADGSLSVIDAIYTEKAFIYAWLLGIAANQLVSKPVLSTPVNAHFCISVMSTHISSTSSVDYFPKYVTTIADLHSVLQRLDGSYGFSIKRVNKVDYYVDWSPTN